MPRPGPIHRARAYSDRCAEKCGAPIGSGMGIQNEANIRILREVITGVPLILDAGVGTASDAAIAMELGADAVLMNTGIAAAQDPVLMAEAMKHAVIAGRQAFLAGRMAKNLAAYWKVCSWICVAACRKAMTRPTSAATMTGGADSTSTSHSAW